MSPKSLRSGFLFLLFLLQVTMLAEQVVTQSIGGTFFGVVKDPTGPVPQAEVRITNLATGQGRFVFTDEQGRYELREVPPGLYELKVSKDGYNTVATPPTQGLQLGLAQVARVDDITLKVAPAGTMTVEVSALDLAMTDSDRPTLSTSFTEKQVRELPLSARDVNNLATLAPGAVSVSSFSFANTLVPFSVNGSRGRDNNFIIDSVDNNEPLFGGAATQFTNSEIFSEFSILTGQFQAEYGRNSGSIVNVITKSGEKQLHGSLFWYGQNDALNAMSIVEKESQLTKPARFYENQLGASVGGPIKKDSTWYFGSYQWDRARNDLSQEYPVVATLPTSAGLAMLQSINAANPTPTLTVFLADPTVRTLPTLTLPFAAPCGSGVPNSVGTLNPTNPCTTGSVSVNGQTIPFGTYLVPRANVFDFRDHEGSARIDQKLGQRENFFFRYLFDDLRTPTSVFNDPNRVAFSDLGLLPQWRPILAERTQNFGSSWTHAFDRALNELRFSVSRISSERGPLDADPRSRKLPAITISDANDPNGSFAFAGSPSPSFPAAGNFITLGTDTRSAQVRSNLFQVQENFSAVHGKHSLKFGGNFIETRSDLHQITGDLGHYFYSSFSDFVKNTGLIRGYQRFGNLGGSGGEVLPLRELAQFYFAEDDITVSPSLTLNLGIRYENYGQAYNRVVELSAGTPNSPPHIGRVNSNFAPRLGFAWEFWKNTVLRGGYGIYYDPMFFNIALLAWQSGSISPYVYSGVADDGQGDILFVRNAFPNPPFNSADAQSPFFDVANGVGSADCNGIGLPPGSMVPLKKDFLVEISYFGSRGTKLFQRRNLNPYGGWSILSPPCSNGAPRCTLLRPSVQPSRGTIAEMSNGAYSKYHAIQFSGTKRLRREGFWNGMAFTTAYTWSHMTDNASEVFGPSVQKTALAPAGGPNPGFVFDLSDPFETSTPFPQSALDPRSGERGNSSFDRRHRFALSFAWASPSRGPKAARTLIGNWQLNGVFSAQSGQPFTPINSFNALIGGLPGPGASLALHGDFPQGCGDVGGDGILFNDRPSIGNPQAPLNTVALVADPSCVSVAPGQFSPTGYVDPEGNPIDPATAHFVQNPIGVIAHMPFNVGSETFIAGNAGRNILTGPGTVNFDLSVSKSFQFGAQRRLQFRGDAYDLLNRRNPGPLAGNAFVASAQQVRAIGFDPTSPVFSTNQAAITPTRLSGSTPENAIDAIDVATGKSTFLSRKSLTTSSRRLQLSLKFTF